MAKEATITFKADEDLARLIGEASFDLDESKSKIIRCCVLLSIETVKACPSLVNRIQFKDRTKQ